MSKRDVLNAMRAMSIPEGKRGLWQVWRNTVSQETTVPGGPPVPPGTYTMLGRWTWKTIHTSMPEVVMNDFPSELNTHLGFCIRAYGRVLVTGLGLGCVTRGLLMNKMVTHIDVVERDESVIEMVWPHMPKDARLNLMHIDARELVDDGREDTWDCAWHDLWSDADAGEDHLQRTHAQLLIGLRKRVGAQGAWAFPRKLKRVYSEYLNLWK